MDTTVMIIGLVVLALFILPFYFVARSKSTEETPDDSTHHAAAKEIKHGQKKKHMA